MGLHLAYWGNWRGAHLLWWLSWFAGHGDLFHRSCPKHCNWNNHYYQVAPNQQQAGSGTILNLPCWRKKRFLCKVLSLQHKYCKWKCQNEWFWCANSFKNFVNFKSINWMIYHEVQKFPYDKIILELWFCDNKARFAQVVLKVDII